MAPGKEIRRLLSKEGQTDQIENCKQARKEILAQLLFSRLLADRFTPRAVGIVK